MLRLRAVIAHFVKVISSALEMVIRRLKVIASKT